MVLQRDAEEARHGLVRNALLTEVAQVVGEVLRVALPASTALLKQRLEEVGDELRAPSVAGEQNDDSLLLHRCAHRVQSVHAALGGEEQRWRGQASREAAGMGEERVYS